MKRFWSALSVFTMVAAMASLAQAETVSIAVANSGSGTAAIGGTYQVLWVDQQSTGTGVIDPFVRLQAIGDEEGYNTSAGTPLDTLGGVFTHSLLLSAIPTVNIGGTLYREFLLDINQTSPNSLLSLNQVQIFLSAAQAPDTLTSTGTNPPILTFAGANEIFRLSGVGAVDEIIMDYNRNPGSGAGDMLFYVNNALFTGAGTQFVTFYSQFGTPPGANATNDGFEEWSIRTGTTTVPEPTSILLIGAGILGLGFAKKRLS
jgi:hypothetical protein